MFLDGHRGVEPPSSPVLPQVSIIFLFQKLFPYFLQLGIRIYEDVIQETVWFCSFFASLNILINIFNSLNYI